MLSLLTPSEPVQCEKPCKNGGVCVGLNRCRCAKGFVGTLCETGRFVSVWKTFLRLRFALTPLPCGVRLQQWPSPVYRRAGTGPRAVLTTPAPAPRALLACAVRDCKHERHQPRQRHCYYLFSWLCVCVCRRTCPVVTTVVGMARAVRKAVRESYVDRCGPLGVQLCTKYRSRVYGKFTNDLKFS